MNAVNEILEKIKGYIVHVAGDEFGTSRVAVHSDDGTQLVVVPKGAGVDLVEYISEYVEVAAVRYPEEEGLTRIHVRSYMLLENFDA